MLRVDPRAGSNEIAQVTGFVDILHDLPGTGRNDQAHVRCVTWPFMMRATVARSL